jgi:small subunit ribosomal protein S21
VQSKVFVQSIISAIDEIRSLSGKGDPVLDILVRGNDIEKALRDLKRSLQKDGFFKEMRTRKHYEKPSVKKKRKQLEAERRRRKAMRNRRPERD